MGWATLLGQVKELAKQSGHFSLAYDPENDEWDASFINGETETGCCYMMTAYEAIEGAMAAYHRRQAADVKGGEM